NPQLHASLFEMLLPNTIKDQVKETANLMLVLDANAANYPWEMLCELGQEPLAVRFGLLRQLKTPQYRPNVRSARDKRALVIGEPNTEDPDIPRLKGAREEAEMVAEQLEKFGYEVVAKIDATTPEIVSALYGHEYRIVHICAHGSYNASRPDHSGVVLAKDRFLSAIEFGQLRAVPELVFLNCCHLGSIDTTPWNLLAASVARQLISIGVRAVVAAGWRVNDRAARDFGVQFYQHMLAEHGQFGEAVLRARRAIRNDYPDNNTWGAFQCYGLPTFSLVDRVHRSTARNVQPVTSNELIEQIRRVRVDAETATPARQQELVCELHRYTNLLRNEWRTGRALYDLGEAFAALDELQTAIDLYKDALCAKETKCETPIRAKEQLGHVKVRRAVQLWRAAQQAAAGGGQAETSQEERVELLNDARNDLELALKFGETTERFSLLGSCHKRLAMESAGKERATHLQQALDYYQKACSEKLQDARATYNPYPALNCIPLQLMINGDEENERKKPAFLREVEACERYAQLRQDERSDFWERVHAPDAALVRLLVENYLETQAGALEERANHIVQLYREVFEMRATAYQRASVINQLDFLSEMLAGKKKHALAARLSKLRRELEM
ncbi:MAG: CHAT domain-containing protein, partial [Caldilinea sp.]